MKTLAFGVILLMLKVTQCDDSLKSLHILFRHGERSPSRSYLYDPHRNYSWPSGWNQLSNRGKVEIYDLGRNIRKEYPLFIPKYYPGNLNVLSSYADRCYMSAQLFLAGMFPPVDEQIWNWDLLWQPIPIRSVARADDNKLALKRTCPKYQKALSELNNLEEIKALNEKNKDLYKYLTKNSGDKVNTILGVESLYNILEIEQLNGLDLPSWTKSVFPHKMKDLAAISLRMFTYTDFMKRMHGGELVKEIVTNIKSKIDGVSTPDQKLHLYSGHDLTVVSLLNILGFDEVLKPEFGAAVIVEHHHVDNQNLIKILYKKNPYVASEEKVPIYCDKVCSFDKFVEAMKKYIPQNWEEECND